MQKISLPEVAIKAQGISTVIRSVTALSNGIIHKVKDESVKRFLRLQISYSRGNAVTCTFMEAVILRSFNEALAEDYGKGCTIPIPKEVLREGGFNFSSDDEVAEFAKKLQAAVPQFSELTDNGNGFAHDEICFRVFYESTIAPIVKMG